jgi:hypothetical protein
MEQHEGGGGDRADAPRAEGDSAQRFEGRLEQGVAAFGRSAGGRVQQVDVRWSSVRGASEVFLIGVVSVDRSPS